MSLADEALFLEKLRNAFSENNAMGIKAVSNDSIREAALNTSKRFALISVISYSLMKLLSKEHITESGNWNYFRKKVIQQVENARVFLINGDSMRADAELRALLETIASIDEKLGHYVTDSINKARLKMASSAYAFGMSLGTASDLTGAGKKDLMEYIGSTKMHDEEAIEMSISQRIKKFSSVMKEG